MPISIYYPIAGVKGFFEKPVQPPFFGDEKWMAVPGFFGLAGGMAFGAMI
jgi:hypothetical protein